MNRPSILLVGSGGHAQSCIDVIECEGRFDIAGLIGLPEQVGTTISKHSVIGSDADLPDLVSDFAYALVTVGQVKSAESRERLFGMLAGIGYLMPTIISASAYVSANATVGPGSIVMHGAIVNSGADVGSNCIINSRALLEHGVKVGNNCHVSTGAIVNGNCKLGDGTFIGSGAVVREMITIGKNCLIGMGQTIRSDCLDGFLTSRQSKGKFR